MRRLVAMFLVLSGVWAPQAVAAAPTLVSPANGATTQARSDQGITFTVNGPPSNSTMRVRVSARSTQDADGLIDFDQGLMALTETPGNPGVYTGTLSPASNAPIRSTPGTYYWQANYFQGGCAPNCYAVSEVRTLTVTPLPPPTAVSPATGATVPYGGTLVLTINDPPYRQDGTTTRNIELGHGNRLDDDGTFADADSMLTTQPLSAGGNSYEYRFGPPFTQYPGTYYWHALRRDCSAEPDCYVVDPDIRSFTVLPQNVATAPDTFFTQVPPKKSRRKVAMFAFGSSAAGATFQCDYAQGWSACVSPQSFRLHPGRYSFGVRAVANGFTDSSPATYSWKVKR
jgi:hypothetical protein